jgi:hypothetical protein
LAIGVERRPRPGWPTARWPAWAPLALLLLVVVAAYGPAVPNFFVSDDLDMLSGDAADLFSPASGFGRFMPLAAAVHRATAALSGLDPVPPHLVQLALHATAALLVYALGRALGLRVAPAWSAALLWALFPRHHQVVMWFGAISIGLSAVFGLAAAWLFVEAWRSRRAAAGWGAVGAYALALLAHESAVALPLLCACLAVYLWTSERVAPPRPPPAWLWAAVAVCLAHLTVLAWAYRARAALYPDSGYRFLGVGADLLLAPARYAAWLASPPPGTEALATGAVGLVVGGVLLLLAALWAWRDGPLVRLGLAWTAAAAAPVLLFGVYGVADRYCYLPAVGLVWAVVGALAGWRLAVPALAAYAALALVLLAQTAGEWRLAGEAVRATMDDLRAWAAAPRAARPEAALFVGVPFKRGTAWPGSQVYVFSTGLVGAAHLATGWPALRVSYVFTDEYPALAEQLAALPALPGPAGLHLFALEPAPTDHTPRLGAALPLLAAPRWRGGSRLPVDLGRYLAGGAPAAP